MIDDWSVVGMTKIYKLMEKQGTFEISVDLSCLKEEYQILKTSN